MLRLNIKTTDIKQKKVSQKKKTYCLTNNVEGTVYQDVPIDLVHPFCIFTP